jgi:hypothetical protein
MDGSQSTSDRKNLGENSHDSPLSKSSESLHKIPDQRRWRIRFSLATLLLLCAVIGLGFSHFLTSLRFAKAQKELLALRNETGYLTVSDPSRVHVIEVPTADDNTFRWRVRLPEHRKFWAHLIVSDELPHEGVPKGNPGGYGTNLSTPGHPQEFILTVAARHVDGMMKLTLFDDNSTGIERSGLGVSADSDYAAWLTNTSSKIEAGQGVTQSAPAGEPLILLRWGKPYKGGGSAPGDYDPKLGIMVWIEEQK